MLKFERLHPDVGCLDFQRPEERRCSHQLHSQGTIVHSFSNNFAAIPITFQSPSIRIMMKLLPSRPRTRLGLPVDHVFISAVVSAHIPIVSLMLRQPPVSSFRDIEIVQASLKKSARNLERSYIAAFQKRVYGKSITIIAHLPVTSTLMCSTTAPSRETRVPVHPDLGDPRLLQAIFHGRTSLRSAACCPVVQLSQQGAIAKTVFGTIVMSSRELHIPGLCTQIESCGTEHARRRPRSSSLAAGRFGKGTKCEKRQKYMYLDQSECGGIWPVID